MFYGLLVLECLLFALHLHIDRKKGGGANYWLEITSFLATALIALLVYSNIVPSRNLLAFSFFFSAIIAILHAPRKTAKGFFGIVLAKRVFLFCIQTGAIYCLLLLYNNVSTTVLYIIAIALITFLEGIGLFSRYGPKSLKGTENLESRYPEIASTIKDKFKEVPSPELFFYDDRRINAHLFYRGVHRPSLILSSGAVLELNRNELHALILHEKTHLTKKHRQKVIISNYLCSILLITILHIFIWTYGSILGICLFLLIIDFLFEGTVFLKNFLSHRHEWEADSYACQCGYKEHLLSALYKASEKNNPGVKKEHGCILLNNHPSIQNRITRINLNETRNNTKKGWGIRNLLQFKDDLAPHIPLFIAGTILVVLSSLVSAQVPKYAGRLLDSISQCMSVSPEIIKMGGTTILLFLAGTFCKIANDYVLFVFGEKSVISIKKRIFSILMRKDLAFYDNMKTGEILSIVNVNSNVLKSAFSSKLSTIIYRPAIIIFCLANMASINIKLTLAILCVLPLLHMILSKQMTKLKELSKKTLNCYSRSNALLQEALNMIVTVKSFSQEQNEGKKFNNSLAKAYNQALKSKRVSIFIELMVTLASVALLSIVIGFAAKLITTGELTSGELVSFLIFTIMITNSFSAFTSALGGIHQAAGAADTIINITESGNIEDFESNFQVYSSDFSNSIELEGIKFSYPTRKEIIIYDDLNFVIQKGKRIGIIGSSGVGKTTLIQILLRFYPISEGTIKIDGNNIYEIPLSAYRHLFAYIPQEVKLFSGTIRYNLTYGRENVTEQELTDTCRCCQCYDFICDLPNGFETVVGENGVTLSGGQKQRIAIARAIISNAQIFILDEITSAIDEKTERIINDDILNYLFGKTLMVISHRQDIIARMDSVYEVTQNTLKKIR